MQLEAISPTAGAVDSRRVGTGEPSAGALQHFAGTMGRKLWFHCQSPEGKTAMWGLGRDA